MTVTIRKGQDQNGFTLLEVLLAAAVFGISGFMLAIAFNNGQMALLNWESHTEVQKIYDWALKELDLTSLSLDELEQGGDFRSVEGYQVEWEAEAIPTATLDLFVVEVFVSIRDGATTLGEFQDMRLYHHDGWYEEDDREKLIEEKTEFFERMQSERKYR